MKRIMDIIVSLIVIVVFIPVAAIICLILAFIPKHAVIFSQTRPGFQSIPFSLYKFCTMSNATDSNGKLLPDSVRLTSVGKILRKLSLDELPQLWSVLKGDMSLVGPRPLLMEYLPLYSKDQARRHLVKPGIIGWAQVNGRNSLSWEKKFELDLWYVDNRTFWLDIKILWMTFVKVIRRDGISAAGEATMEKFRGKGS